MNPFFKNINIFLPEKSTFSQEKFRKIEHILHEFLKFSKKYFKDFNFSGGIYKSRKSCNEFYYVVGIFIKKVQKWLRKRTFGNGMKSLANFGENQLDIVEKLNSSRFEERLSSGR